MPVTALTLLYEEYSTYEIVSLLLHSTKLSIIELTYIKDKSSAEVLFYIAIVLAILLFLIVIPLCEVLLFGTAIDEEQQLEHDIKSYYQHGGVDYNTNNNNNNNNNSRLLERSHTTLFDEQEYYWYDDDDEVELNDLALTLSRSSSNTSVSRGGSVGSGSSANSHGSSTMETIEESGEEDANDDDDVDEDQELLLVKGGGSSSTSSCTDESCPDLNETTDDYDDEDEVFNSNGDTEFKDQVNYLFFGYTRSSRE
jgi:lipopolysaccharide assembly outer membrane protein LptD (OstA)